MCITAAVLAAAQRRRMLWEGCGSVLRGSIHAVLTHHAGKGCWYALRGEHLFMLLRCVMPDAVQHVHVEKVCGDLLRLLNVLRPLCL